MNPHPISILAIEPDPKKPSLLRISIGPPKRRAAKSMIDRRDADQLGLSVGMAWTASLQSAFDDALLMTAARRKAHQWINRRPLSRAALTERLAKAGYEPPLIERLIAELEEVGLIDDGAYAKAVVEHERSRKPIGERLLREKLASRGIDEHDTNTAIDEHTGPDHDPLAEALTLARATLAKQPAKLDPVARARRVLGVLARRGFDESIAEDAVRRAMGREFPME